MGPIPRTPLAHPLFGSVLQCAVPVVFCSPDSYCIVVWYPLAWSIVAARILCWLLYVASAPFGTVLSYHCLHGFSPDSITWIIDSVSVWGLHTLRYSSCMELSLQFYLTVLSMDDEHSGLLPFLSASDYPTI